MTLENFVKNLQWRGLIHNSTPNIEQNLASSSASGYIGFDPTSDSLHIGNLLQMNVLRHFQLAGHTPIILLGGATGMIGDPAGKKEERKLLNRETLENNCLSIQEQMTKFLDFNPSTKNAAKLLNNYDWIKDYSLIDFSREIGKHITVNYMMAKDSVKNRIKPNQGSGMSFTEFTYQLLQGFDFYHLYKNYNCTLQMGGSDQWGNITTGIELIRRKLNKPAYGITCPLITKEDGSKFGKTEQGNIWLDPKLTSPFRFYQYWINLSDKEAKKLIKVFTFLNQVEIENLLLEHQNEPHLRKLQSTLANELTQLVHSRKDLDVAKTASNILFGRSTLHDFKSLSYQNCLDVFEGLPTACISKEKLNDGFSIIDALILNQQFFKSKGQAKRAIEANSISVNKEKVNQTYQLTSKDLIAQGFILLQSGKKNYCLLIIN
ncbi:MAG: tyrosine--tRNA ligase [Flavobacteriaceae bacterium]|nr:tyrosine--tRNA ligase [Flavobacteriaceae bacterium]MCY4268289.1 tyrosine--tRNA ligase [Flavobacteriaceae bacterium]MCY4298515.1 tyrosine--tRNA ligase [Flavobacteriaceae bacterium]